MSADASVQAFGVVAGSAISVITFAAITRALGPSVFGHFAAAIAFLAIPTLLLDQGLTTAVVREMSRRPESAAHALRASLPLRIVASVVVLALTVGLAYVLPFPGEVRYAVLIGSVGSFFALMGGGVVPVLQSEHRMVWTVVATISGRALTLLMTLEVIREGASLTGVLRAYVAGLAATALIQIYAVSRRVRITPVWDPGYSRRLLGEGGTLGAATGVGLVYWRIDVVLIALIRGSREVGLYTAAYKFADLAQAFAAGIYTSLFAPLTRFLAAKDPRARALVQKVFEILFALSAPGAVLAALFAPQIVVLFAGHQYEDGATALRILALVPVFSFVAGLLERGLIAVGQERLVLITNFVGLTVNVALNLWLIPRFGFVAAAVTTVITDAVWLLVGGAFFRIHLGFLPDVRPLGGLGASVVAMAVVGFLVPGPALLAASVSLLAYLALICLAPGVVRNVARDTLQILTRRAMSRRRSVL
jgi:O-antigen/teichoic acid export membrane protein